jgi:hypothetical protein
VTTSNTGYNYNYGTGNIGTYPNTSTNYGAGSALRHTGNYHGGIGSGSNKTPTKDLKADAEPQDSEVKDDEEAAPQIVELTFQGVLKEMQ